MKQRRSQENFDLINYRSMIGKPFGGSRLKGNPKTRRPFSRKHLIHVILKSSHARGGRSFLHPKNKKTVDGLIRRLAVQFHIEIRDYVNVGNHLHLLIKTSHRLHVGRFLRSLTGVLPRKLLNCEKGEPLGFSFWDGRPFTKIIAEGFRPFRNIKAYFNKNRRQANERTRVTIAVEGFDLFPLFNSA